MSLPPGAAADRIPPRGEEQFARLVESISDYLWSAETAPGATLTYRYFSPVVLRITGRAPEYYVGCGLQVWLETIDVQDRHSVQRAMQRLLQGDLDRLDLQYRILRPDGSLRWVRDSIHATRLANGHLLLDGVVSDITDRQLAATALRESEERFRSLTELSSDWYWRQDENLRFTYLSSQAIDLTGHTGESSYGKTRWELTNMWPLSGSWDDHKAVLAARLPFRDLECCRIGLDGAIRYLSMTGAPLFDEFGHFRGYHGIGRNITEHKRIEAELRARQEMLDLAQAAARAAAFEWRFGWAERHTRWSPDLEPMLGITPGAYDGTFESWKKLVHPDDQPIAEDAIKRASDAGDVSFEYRVVHSDGSTHWLQLKGRLRVEDGTNARLVGFMLDVTERHKAEEDVQRLEHQLNQVRSELARVARVTSFSTLAASITHEVSQPLAGVITNASTCVRVLDADPPNLVTARESARRIIRDGNRAAEVITRLRAMFSKKNFTLERMDLNEATREVIALSLNELRRHEVQVQSQLAPDLPRVAGDRIQLQQVVLNLLRNAAEAMADVRDRPRIVLIRSERESDDAVRLSVSDTGVGFDSVSMDKLFDAFYTTKSGGMGIGLSVSRSIIERHQGRLRAQPNDDGPGATFFFTIPLNVEHGT
ncbi:MAG TPA: PAS domain-containing protein [Ramlibacter sp.]|nr:PAS domain-containing protein [Ramlibacter sp.]